MERNSKVTSMFKSLLPATVCLCAAASAALADVNVYSYRQPDLVAPVFDAFTEETGIKVNTVFLNKGLKERLVAEEIAPRLILS